MKNVLKKIAGILFLSLIITLASCSNNPIDVVLDNYESVVVKFEKQVVEGKKVTMNDIVQAQQGALQGVDISNVLKGYQPTEKQMQRAMELARRMQRVMGY